MFRLSRISWSQSMNLRIMFHKVGWFRSSKYFGAECASIIVCIAASLLLMSGGPISRSSSLLRAGFQIPSLGYLPGFKRPNDANWEQYLKICHSKEPQNFSQLLEQLTHLSRSEHRLWGLTPLKWHSHLLNTLFSLYSNRHPMWRREHDLRRVACSGVLGSSDWHS